jgi:hypothetical protein
VTHTSKRGWAINLAAASFPFIVTTRFKLHAGRLALGVVYMLESETICQKDKVYNKGVTVYSKDGATRPRVDQPSIL